MACLVGFNETEQLFDVHLIKGFGIVAISEFCDNSTLLNFAYFKAV